MSTGQVSRKEAFENAIADYEKGISIRKSAKKWGVSAAGLWKRVNGKVFFEQPGRRQVLTTAEEQYFTQWILERSELGFGVSKQQFLDSVKLFLDTDQRQTPFMDNRPGDKWYSGFMKRNPQTKLRFEKKRAKKSSPDLDIWSKNYKTFIQELGLLDCPEQIWICEESRFDLKGRTGLVTGPSATKHQPSCDTTGTKEHLTVLPCFNAGGESIPPYIVYPGQHILAHYNPLEGGVPGSIFSFTKNGCMDSFTLYTWLIKHFIPHLPPARPVVVLIDSLGHHIDLETLELARQHGVHLYALLQNTSHVVHQAGVGIFAAVKQSWSENVKRFTQLNPNTDITKNNFSLIFRSTWEEVMKPCLLVDAFRKSGLYPIATSVKQSVNDLSR